MLNLFFSPDREHKTIPFWDITNMGIDRYGRSNPKDKAMQFWENIECEMQPFIAVKEHEKRLRKRDCLRRCFNG